MVSPAQRAVRVTTHLTDRVDLFCEECRLVPEVDGEVFIRDITLLERKLDLWFCVKNLENRLPGQLYLLCVWRGLYHRLALPLLR